MTSAELERLKTEFYPEERWSSASVKARVQDADLSVKELDEIVTSLGGILCDCEPVRHPIAPAGSCDICGVKGPFYVKVNGVSHVNGYASKYKPIDWHAAFRTVPTEVDWLFPPLIEAGTVNALFGLPGVGKSLLTLDIALQVIAEDKTVMIVDEENREADLVERLRKFGKGPDDLDRLVAYSFASLPPLDTPEGGKHLFALAQEHQPALVILDTASRMLEGDENSASTFLSFYRCSLVPLKGEGIATLRLDHQGKDPSKGQRGSSAKDGDVDTIWRLRFQDGGMLALEREKTRSSHGEEWVLIERVQDPLGHRFVELDHLPITPRIRHLAQKFDEWGIPRDAGRPTLRAAVKEKWKLAENEDERNAGVSTTILQMVVRYRKDQLRAVTGQHVGHELGSEEGSECPFLQIPTPFSLVRTFLIPCFQRRKRRAGRCHVQSLFSGRILLPRSCLNLLRSRSEGRLGTFVLAEPKRGNRIAGCECTRH